MSNGGAFIPAQNGGLVSSGGGGGIASLAGGTTTATGPLVSFANSNNITFGVNGNTVTASFAGGGATGNFGALAAGTQTATSGTVVLSNSNGVSFGMAGSSQVTASVAAGATATGNLGAIAGGTQTATSGTIVFSNSNNVSFGLSGSTRMTASIPSGATATGNLGAIAAGSQTATSGTVVFSNSNGISLGLSGSSRVTAQYEMQYVVGGVAGTQSLAGSNPIILSDGPSQGGVWNFTAPNRIGYIVTAAPAYSAGTTSVGHVFAASTLVFSNSNGVNFGLNGSSITARVASVSGTQGENVTIQASSAPIVISNASNNGHISLIASGASILISNNGANGHISLIAGDSAGAGAGSISAYANSIVLSADNNAQVIGGVLVLKGSGNIDMPAGAIAIGANGYGLTCSSVQVQQNSTGNLGFFSAAGTNRVTITGASTNATLVLNNLLNALNSLGLISKSTT